jgi:DNA-directed RNA polymerase subunit RPC12/RpoP
MSRRTDRMWKAAARVTALKGAPVPTAAKPTLTTYSCAKCTSNFKENPEVVMDGGKGLWCPRCSYQASVRYLKAELPKEFFAEFMTTNAQYDPAHPQGKPSAAAELLEAQVVREYSRVTDEAGYKPWPGPQKDVHCWWELENGKAVGWNENPSKGWSFPVITLHNLKIWNIRGDYSDFDGHFYVCASTKKRAVELLNQAGRRFTTLHEFTGYASEAWGIAMRNQGREEGVWFTPKGEDDVMGGYRPKRLL